MDSVINVFQEVVLVVRWLHYQGQDLIPEPQLQCAVSHA